MRRRTHPLDDSRDPYSALNPRSIRIRVTDANLNDVGGDLRWRRSVSDPALASEQEMNAFVSGDRGLSRTCARKRKRRGCWRRRPRRRTPKQRPATGARVPDVDRRASLRRARTGNDNRIAAPAKGCLHGKCINISAIDAGGGPVERNLQPSLLPRIRVEFPSPAFADIAARKHDALAIRIVNHLMAKAWSGRARARELRPARAVPLPRIAQHYLILILAAEDHKTSSRGIECARMKRASGGLRAGRDNASPRC